MTTAEFRTLGASLWGSQWQSAMARALGVNARTVRRWAAGDYAVPGPVQIALRALQGAKR